MLSALGCGLSARLDTPADGKSIYPPPLYQEHPAGARRFSKCGLLLRVRREALHEVRCRHGAGEQVALAEAAAEGGKGGLLDLLLHPLGDRAQAQRVAERD